MQAVIAHQGFLESNTISAWNWSRICSTSLNLWQRLVNFRFQSLCIIRGRCIIDNSWSLYSSSRHSNFYLLLDWRSVGGRLGQCDKMTVESQQKPNTANQKDRSLIWSAFGNLYSFVSSGWKPRKQKRLKPLQMLSHPDWKVQCGKSGESWSRSEMILRIRGVRMRLCKLFCRPNKADRSQESTAD